MPVTLADISARAEVSLSTVSRVLNNKEHVSTPTRNAVLEALTSLGYTRQDARREENLDTVLLFVHEGSPERMTDGTMAQDMERLIVAGAQNTLRAAGFLTQLAHKQLGRTTGFTLPRVSNLVGAINIGSTSNINLLRKMVQDGVPTVVAGSPAPELPLDSVTLDFKGALQQIVQYLAGRGHRTIGLVNGPPTTGSSTARSLAFRLALLVEDLPCAQEQMVSGNYSFSSGDTMTEQILAACPTVDALIYADDDMAVGGLRALRGMGRKVPEDIAVVGMFNYDIGNYTDPRLTTVDIDKYEIGRAAALRLAMRLQGDVGPHWSITLPTQLILRDSA